MELTGTRMRTKAALSETGFAQDPGGLTRRLDKVFLRAEPVMLCTHRPLLPTLLELLADRAVHRADRDRLHHLARAGMSPGDVVATTLVGSADTARLTSVCCD